MSEKVHISTIFDETGCLNLNGMRSYLNGSLKRHERSEAAGHLSECELCAEAIGGIEMETDDRLVLGSVAAITAAIREKSGSGAPEHAEPPSGESSGGTLIRPMWMASAAAVVLLLIGIGIVISGDNEGISTQQEEVASANLPEVSDKKNMDKAPAEKPPLFADGNELANDRSNNDDADMVGAPAPESLKKEAAKESPAKLVDDLSLDDVVYAESFDEELAVAEEVAESRDEMDDFASSEQNEFGANLNEKALGNTSKEEGKAFQQNTEFLEAQKSREAKYNFDTSPTSIDNKDVTISNSSGAYTQSVSPSMVDDAEAADVNQGFLTDVYKVEEDEARYNGVKQLGKKAKADSDNRRKRLADTKNAESEDQVAARPQQINAPGAVYYDSDKSTWSRNQTQVDAGMRSYASSDFAEAIRQFDLALQSEPFNEEALFYSGVSYFELSLYHNAEQQFDQLIDQKNKRFGEEALWYKAEILVRRQEISGVKKVLKALIKVGGDYRQRAEERLDELK